MKSTVQADFIHHAHFEPKMAVKDTSSILTKDQVEGTFQGLTCYLEDYAKKSNMCRSTPSRTTAAPVYSDISCNMQEAWHNVTNLPQLMASTLPVVSPTVTARGVPLTAIPRLSDPGANASKGKQAMLESSTNLRSLSQKLPEQVVTISLP